jgi:hypothetical protein
MKNSNTQDVGTAEVPVQLRFSSTEPARGYARIVERSRRWRTTGALRQLAIWWGLALLVVWIPPHLPWALIALSVGAIRAYGRYSEERTLVSLRGPCPKCGNEQEFAAGVPLKDTHTVTCAACQWELKVDVPRSPATGARSADDPAAAR